MTKPTHSRTEFSIDSDPFASISKAAASQRTEDPGISNRQSWNARRLMKSVKSAIIKAGNGDLISAKITAQATSPDAQSAGPDALSPGTSNELDDEELVSVGAGDVRSYHSLSGSSPAGSTGFIPGETTEYDRYNRPSSLEPKVVSETPISLGKKFSKMCSSLRGTKQRSLQGTQDIQNDPVEPSAMFHVFGSGTTARPRPSLFSGIDVNIPDAQMNIKFKERSLASKGEWRWNRPGFEEIECHGGTHPESSSLETSRDYALISGSEVSTPTPPSSRGEIDAPQPMSLFDRYNKAKGKQRMYWSSVPTTCATEQSKENSGSSKGVTDPGAMGSVHAEDGDRSQSRTFESHTAEQEKSLDADSSGVSSTKVRTSFDGYDPADSDDDNSDTFESGFLEGSCISDLGSDTVEGTVTDSAFHIECFLPGNLTPEAFRKSMDGFKNRKGTQIHVHRWHRISAAAGEVEYPELTDSLSLEGDTNEIPVHGSEQLSEILEDDGKVEQPSIAATMISRSAAQKDATIPSSFSLSSLQRIALSTASYVTTLGLRGTTIGTSFLTLSRERQSVNLSCKYQLASSNEQLMPAADSTEDFNPLERVHANQADMSRQETEYLSKWLELRRRRCTVISSEGPVLKDVVTGLNRSHISTRGNVNIERSEAVEERGAVSPPQDGKFVHLQDDGSRNAKSLALRKIELRDRVSQWMTGLETSRGGLPPVSQMDEEVSSRAVEYSPTTRWTL